MAHWIFNCMTVQTIIEKLDLNLITLKYAKSYFEAYGVTVKGNTKKDFIKNLITASKEV